MVEIEVLAYYMLHAGRSGFDTEENALAAGPGHQVQQFLVNAIGAAAAGPLVSGAALEKSLAEFDGLRANGCECVVNQAEGVAP